MNLSLALKDSRPAFGRRKTWAVLASVSAHAALVLAASHAHWSKERSAGREPLNVIWLNGSTLEAGDRTDPITPQMTRPDPITAPTLPEERADTPAPANRIEERPPPATPTPEEATGPAAEAAPPSPSLADWERERQRAVNGLIERQQREDAYTSFSFPAVDEPETQDPDVAEKSVFDSPSKGRAGLEDVTASGEWIKWVTDECYQITGGTRGMFLDDQAQDLMAMTRRLCVRTNPRSDLFAHLKPEYLKYAKEAPLLRGDLLVSSVSRD